MLTDAEEFIFREAAFSWIRARQIHDSVFTRDDLSRFPFHGKTYRLIGPQTGIWKVSSLSDSAIGISTAYVPDSAKRPYADEIGDDGLLRYKWRGTNANGADNVALRRAMERGLPMVYYVGVAYKPGTQTQLYQAILPVFLVGEEPAENQFVVAVEPGQQMIRQGDSPTLVDIVRRYNTATVRTRVHQPVFRARVILAYEQKCAVCRLPFSELLEAAHIKPDSEGGPARVSNGLSLCKIHHGAYDTNILGISPDYKIHIRKEVLDTFDGPTLQHALKEMDGEGLRQIPESRESHPDKELLAERFEKFKVAS